MYPRTEYEMTEADLKDILDACKPVPYMVMGGRGPSSPQENANRAWASLGGKMGFDHMTVQPISGKAMRFFTAVPSETPEARAEREKREASEKRKLEIERLSALLAENHEKLRKLQSEEEGK